MQDTITAWILLLGIVLIGGCTGAVNPDNSVTESTTTTLGPTLGTTSYPERPDALSEETVRGFVVDCERAVLQNEDNTMATNISATIESTVDQTATGTFVATLHVEAVVRYANGHGDVEHDVRYFVNESTVLRMQSSGEQTPDLRNGTVVQCG